MARKIILALAGLAASLTLAVGLAAAGFAPFPPPADTLVPGANDPVAGAVTTRKAPEPDVVYVKPAPKPRTIVRTVTDRPHRSTGYVSARPQRSTRIGAREEREHEGREREGSEHESGEDD